MVLTDSMRRNLAKTALILAVVAATYPQMARAAVGGTITGRVLAVATQQRLSNANIVLGGTSRYAITDSAGTFHFGDLSPGTYRVYASHVGFKSQVETVDVSVGLATDVHIGLVEQPGQMDPVVVTASRTPSSLLRSSLSAHVVENSAQSIGLPTAGELLRHLPGVDLSGGGAPGLVEGISLRGAAPGQTLFLLDGMRLNAAGRTSTLGGVDLSEIGVDRIDRVEVIKGSGSALYGHDAAGGVVHIFTRGLPQDRRTVVSISTGAGSRVDEDGIYGTQRYHLFHGRRQDQWEWSADGSMGASGGHLENTDARIWNAGGRIVRHRDDGQTAMRVDLVRRRGGSPGAEGQGQSGAFDVDDRQNDDIARLGVSETRPLGPGVHFEGIASGQWWRVQRLNPIVQAGELAGDFRSTHLTWMVDPRVHLTRPHLRPLSIGVEYRIERQRDDLFGTETASDGAAYAQNRFEIGKHVAEIGMRLDHHSLYGTQVNPRASSLMQLRENLVLHAAVGRAYVAPSFDDLFKPTELFQNAIGDVVGETGNRDLKSEKVWSADVGLRGQTEHIQGEATVYWSRYRDLIQPVLRRMNVDGREGLLLSFGNLAKADISGLELLQSFRFGGSNLQLSYTFQSASGKDATGASRNLPGRLRQKFTGDYQRRLGLNGGVELSLRADWQERYFDEDLFKADEDDLSAEEEVDDDEAAGIGAPAGDWRYLNFGASVHYRLSASVALYADAANLTDERYQSVFGIPQPGLVFTVGLRLLHR